MSVYWNGANPYGRVFAPGGRMVTGMDTKSAKFLKSGGFTTNPNEWSGRVGSAFAEATSQGTAALTLYRDENRTTSVLTVAARKKGRLDNASVEAAARSLAQAYGSKAEMLIDDEAESFFDHLSDAQALGELKLDSTEIYSANLHGVDPVELARTTAANLPANAWVQVVARQPSKAERKNWVRWLTNKRGGNNNSDQSFAQNPVVVSFRAGGESTEDVDQILRHIKGSMPGFSMDTEVAPVRRVSPAWKSLFFGVPALALGVLGAVNAWAVQSAWLVVSGLGLLACVLGVLACVKIIPSPLARALNTLATGDIAPIPAHVGRVHPPRKEKTTMVKGVARIKPAYEGDYPLAETAFMVHPSTFAAIGSPHGSVASGEESSAHHPASPAMLEANGPVIGYRSSDDHTAVHLGAEDARLGVFVNGRAGSGKSRTIQSFWAFSVMERMDPSLVPGNPGRNNGLIALESKGTGAQAYVTWSQRFGDEVTLMNVADVGQPAIDIFAVPGTVMERAAFVTSALRYVYGEEGVGPRSAEALNSLLPSALLLNQDEVEARSNETGSVLRQISGPLSPMGYLHLLLGAQGNEVFDALEQVVKSMADDDDFAHQDEAIAAHDALGFIADKTASQRGIYCEAPRNKLQPLASQLDVWFTPNRAKLTWDEIITGHKAVVINTGATPDSPSLDESSVSVISSLLMYTLWQGIKRNCAGWESQNKWTSFFTDELSLIAGVGGSVLKEGKDQGRDYGFRPHYATQRPEQLPKDLRSNLLAYDTVASYSHNDADTAEEIAKAMGGGFTADDVRTMEPYHAVVVTTVNGRRQPPTIVAAIDFEADPSAFESIQRG